MGFMKRVITVGFFVFVLVLFTVLTLAFS